MSLDGADWRDNEQLINWQCGKCRALFAGTDRAGARAHLQAEGGGTLYPKVSTIGAQMIATLPPLRDRVGKLTEPQILDMMGFRAEVVQPAASGPIGGMAAKKRWSLETFTLGDIDDLREAVKNGDPEAIRFSESEEMRMAERTAGEALEKIAVYFKEQLRADPIHESVYEKIKALRSSPDPFWRAIGHSLGDKTLGELHEEALRQLAQDGHWKIQPDKPAPSGAGGVKGKAEQPASTKGKPTKAQAKAKEKAKQAKELRIQNKTRPAIAYEIGVSLRTVDRYLDMPSE